MTVKFGILGIVLLLSGSAGISGGLSAEFGDGLVVVAENVPTPGCRAQLNDSSCRPDKFPLHNPDPSIPAPPIQPVKPKNRAKPANQIGGKSFDCLFGTPKCFCTNDMAADKAGNYGVIPKRVFGYADRVLINGTKGVHQVEMTFTREVSCPVIGFKRLA